MTTQHRLESPGSNHRLALLLNMIDFQLESVSSPGWELFDETQVAGVLEQCQESNLDSGSGEPIISVPRLHSILALELATIQVF